MSAISLGDKAQDQITGFEGVVTGKCVYISGCDQILLAGRVKPDGSKAESQWFDIDRCLLIEAGAVKLEQVSSAARPGCDAPAPVK